MTIYGTYDILAHCSTRLLPPGKGRVRTEVDGSAPLSREGKGRSTCAPPLA